MQVASFALACLLLAGPAFASTGRSLSQTTSTSCNAFGSLKVIVKSRTCRGWPRAECQSHAKAKATIVEAVKPLSTLEVCKPIRVQAAATAVARALAQVYVSAFSKVSCNGQGFGCGFGVAQGDAFATGYADALARAVAAALGPSGSAVCLADIRAIAVTFARASAFALSRSCVNGAGTASNFESRFVQQTSDAIAKVIATATAVVCNKPKTESKCGADVFGSSGSEETSTNNPGSSTPSPTGTGSSSGTSGGSTSGGQVVACTDFNEQRCCFEAGWCAKNGLRTGPATNGPHNVLLYKLGSLVPQCFCY